MLGGSFNPLHIGHAMLAEAVIKECGYDKILFVPTCIPPHKAIAGDIDSIDRLRMVAAFCDSVPGEVFVCEPCEFERQGPSYTIDTIKTLYKKYDGLFEGKIGLIMGEEIGAEFPKWKNSEELIKLCDLIIVPRRPGALGEGSSAADFKNKPIHSYKGDFNSKFDKQKLEDEGFPSYLLSEPVIALSSTEIRTRIAAKKSYRYLVPQAVFDYIESKGLYI